MEENQQPDFFEERDVLGQVKPNTNHKQTSEEIFLQEDINSQADLEYATLGSRFFAYVFDVVILFIIMIIIEELIFDKSYISEFSILRTFIALFVWTVYYGLTESSESQATFGKRIIGLKVIDINGNRLTFRKAALRYLAQIISILPLGFGKGKVKREQSPTL